MWINWRQAFIFSLSLSRHQNMCVCKVCRWRRTSRPSHTHTSTRNNRLILIVYVRVCVCVYVVRGLLYSVAGWKSHPAKKTYTHPHELCVGKEAEEKNDGTFHNRPSLPKIVWSIPTRERDKRVRDIEAFLCIFPFFFFPSPFIHIYRCIAFVFQATRTNEGGGMY